jgi:phosphoadenosine phosphosulfate reductase
MITSPPSALEGAAQTLHWALRTYRERIVLAVSFGGLGGLVLLDVALRLDPKLPVYFLDTGLLFPQTYAFVKQVEARYGISVTAVRPERTVAEQARDYGEALWAREPDTCCSLRKVQPHRAFLAKYDAWITGLHRTTLETRQDIARVAWDAGANAVKVSPLAQCSAAELLAYAREHDLPRNPLADAGYASIGCVPCTRAVDPGEDARAGRWADFTKTECGLHLPGSGADSAGATPRTAD